MRSGGRNAAVLAERVAVLRQTCTLGARLSNRRLLGSKSERSAASGLCAGGIKADPGFLPLLGGKGGKPLTPRGRYREDYRAAAVGIAGSRQQLHRYSYRAVGHRLGHRPVRGV